MTERKILDGLPEHPTPDGLPGGRLRVLGLGGESLSLDTADLRRMRQTTVAEDFVCEEGWTAPRQTWRGVLAGDVLDAAGVADHGGWVEFGAGAFCFSLPMEEARGALIALTLNDEPLTRAHGGPCRLYVPGEACYTSIKWLDRIAVRQAAGPNQAEKIATARLASEVRGDGDGAGTR